MAKVLYAGNNNDVVISPVRRRGDGTIETGVVFSVTLYDPSNNPIAGATALNTSFEATTLSNVVTIPGTVALTPGPGYTLVAAATGAFANKIAFSSVPVTVRTRSG